MLQETLRSAPSRAEWFAATHWSVVLAAGGSSDPGARDALERLCREYWSPLYTYARRQGNSPHDAQDLTQGFFAWLLESKHLRLARPERGKFRSFLLIRLKHFLSDERKKIQAQKRGGGQSILSLQEEFAKNQDCEVPSADLTPERAFDHRWAFTLLERSVARLRQEYTEANRVGLFDVLKHSPFSEKGGPSYAEAGKVLGLTESAVKSAVHRLRQRHRQLLREEVARTVAVPADIDEELRYLLAVLGG
jgi:RNA polymerase sigma-70 factor (ECF subfamily)